MGRAITINFSIKYFWRIFIILLLFSVKNIVAQKSNLNIENTLLGATNTMLYGSVSSTSVIYVKVTSNSPVCSGETINLTASSALGVFYNWSGPNGFSAFGQNVSLIATNNSEGTYIVFASLSNGCLVEQKIEIIVNECEKTLQTKLFIQGYYVGGNQMSALLYNLGISGDPFACDTLRMELHEPAFPFALASTVTTILKSDGNAEGVFTDQLDNHPYYISLRHRNSVETWSSTPVLLDQQVNIYNFFDNANKAFGNNQFDLADGNFAIYSGDINQDGSVDGGDFLELDPSIQNGDGGYAVGDFNGDGAVDGADFLLLDPNIQNGIGATIP